MLFFRYVSIAAACCVYAASAHAQSGVINPLYAFGDQKLCPPSKPSDGEKAAKGPVKCSKKKHTTTQNIDHRDVLIYLQSKFPIVPRNRSEYDCKPQELIAARLTPGFETLEKAVLHAEKPAAPEKDKQSGGRGDTCLSKARPPKGDTPSSEAKAVKGDGEPKAGKTPKAPNYRDGARFAKDAAALSFRRSLLRLFEAAYSGGVDNYYVRPNLDLPAPPFEKFGEKIARRDELKNNGCGDGALGNACWRAFIKAYRPLRNPFDDDLMIRAYLRGDKPFLVVFDPDPTPGNPAPEDEEDKRVFADRGDVSSPWIQPTRRLFDQGFSNNGEKNIEKNGVKYKRTTENKFRLVKDAGEFSKSKTEDATFGLVVDMNKSQDASTVNASAALGYTFTRSWGQSTTDKSRTNPALKSRTVALYGSFAQTPGTIVVLDADGVATADGPATKNAAFASGTLLGGVRLDYEYWGKKLPAASSEDLVTRGNVDPLALQNSELTRPGDKFAFSIGAFTDNYFDQQGYQLAAGWLPDLRKNFWGYRDWTRLSYGKQDNNLSRGKLSPLDWFRSGYVRWENEFLIDHIWYGRAPNNAKTLVSTDRLTSADATRVGFDADLKFQWKNMFSPPSDDSRIEFGVEYKFRESLKDQSPTIQNAKFTAGLKDVLSSDYSFNLAYEVGRNILTQEQTDTYTFNLGFGF